MQRRSFLLALGAAFLPGGAASAGAGAGGDGGPVYVSACSGKDGGDYVAAFASDGRLLFRTRLPERGHDIAARPGSPELVVFARRPGNWAAIVDRRTGEAGRVVTASPGRHFYGHGAFTADGTLLYATENDIATGAGVLGLYDPRDGYRRLGETTSGGIGPHDLAFRPDAIGGGILVANGGIRTAPESGREMLNPDAMEPSLAVVEPRSGRVLHRIDLGPKLRGLSIRHLAVAPGGAAAFGCQYTGEDDMPPLVGVLTPDGAVRFLDMPEDDLASLNNYIGSVRLDASGRLCAATSPQGSMTAYWDLADGRYLGRQRMSDVCGVAPGSAPETFVLTSGNAGVRVARPGPQDLARLGGSALDAWMWDNHLVRLAGT